MKDNQITIVDMLITNPKELVASQTIEQKCQTYIALDILVKALKDEEKQGILESGIDGYDGTLPNGMIKTLSVSKGSSRVEDYVDKTIDYDKAIKFAKENNLEIPMTKPQIDYSKLDSMEGFQDHIDEFVKKEIKSKTVTSKDTLRVR